MKILFASAGRMLVTLLVVLAAIVVGWQLWSYYMLAPWTRDGRVRQAEPPGSSQGESSENSKTNTRHH
jgi:hypothetical protein